MVFQILKNFEIVKSIMQLVHWIECCTSGVRTRVQKVKPKMAEIDVMQCQSLSIIVCEVYTRLQKCAKISSIHSEIIFWYYWTDNLICEAEPLEKNRISWWKWYNFPYLRLTQRLMRLTDSHQVVSTSPTSSACNKLIANKLMTTSSWRTTCIILVGTTFI